MIREGFGAFNDPPVGCARCNRQVDRVTRLARIDQTVEFAVVCHGVTKRFTFERPMLMGKTEEWIARVLRDLNDAFKPTPPFRISTRPRRRQPEARR